MTRTSQHCWRKDACQKVNCKFVHQKDTLQFCWRKDACVKNNCNFIHPRDSNNQCVSLDNISKTVQDECLQPEDGNVLCSLIDRGTTSTTRPNAEIVIGISEDHKSSTDSKQPGQTTFNVRPIPTMIFYGTGPQVASASTNHIPISQFQLDSKKKDVDKVGHYPTNRSDVNVAATGRSDQSNSASGQKETSMQSALVSRKSERRESESVVEPLHHTNHVKASTNRGNKKKSAKTPQIQFESKSGNSSPQLPDSVNMPKVKGTHLPKTNSDCESSSRSQSHRSRVQQRGLNMHSGTSAPSSQSITPIQPEWNSDEAMAIVQHHHIIEGINDKISQIIFSEDYSTNYEKHEASIRILRDNLVELESHVSIYDSVKSRACRELSSRPTELRNQIFAKFIA